MDGPFFFSSNEPLPNNNFGSQFPGLRYFGGLTQFAVAFQESNGLLVRSQQFCQDKCRVFNPPLRFQMSERRPIKLMKMRV
jgi:hypothetical protein